MPAMIALAQIEPQTLMSHAIMAEARAEGFLFLDRLSQQAFSSEGEVFLAASRAEHLLGVGGLSRDPYASDPNTGRVRHLYVRANWRRQGVGRLIVEHLLERARPHFNLVRLRTGTPRGAAFYEAIGFRPRGENDCTHCLVLA
jgi:GNAT superfamily N-acetyltransferase